MTTTYRVEKDHKTFYVQPEMLEYYETNGYAIYKTVEQEVTDVQSEIRKAEGEFRNEA